MIPVCEPTLQGNEKKYVDKCVETNWISSSGTFIEEFEKRFSKFCGVKYGVSCSNGTVALHLALASIGIGKGDEVIVPTFSIIAVSNAVLYTGAIPVFVDSEMKTWNMNPDMIEEKITEKTKAIISMHTYGCPVDMDRIRKIADKHNLKIVEDAAEAHGATYKDRMAGSLGDVACFSFYANKIITTGEGGMVVTNDEKIADKARLLRNHAFTKPRFVHYEVGFNYRMTNIQAAIGVAQMERAGELLKGRRSNAPRYENELKGVDGITLPPECPYGTNVYWMYGILIDKDKFGMGKDEVMKELEQQGIETRSFFFPMHLQPVYKKNQAINCGGEYPVSEKLYAQGLYLPSSSHLTNEQIKKIGIALKSLKK
ncbi:DegT/DnrJ/EryC1/StrS family aminotransferase [Candidatus Woesearchaeota archaeon]|nr:DegT/DnrJ/EryC1/StrS family aminotransferase [Candidatus Woesearchaeota archaeon]